MSQEGRVKPCGPHHRARCLGSVHILKTRPRGASNTRVMTSSRSAKPAGALLLSAIVLLLGLNFAQIIFQTIQALLPMAPVLLEPFCGVLQRTSRKLTIAPLRLATARDQA